MVVQGRIVKNENFKGRIVKNENFKGRIVRKKWERVELLKVCYSENFKARIAKSVNFKGRNAKTPSAPLPSPLLFGRKRPKITRFYSASSGGKYFFFLII